MTDRAVSLAQASYFCDDAVMSCNVALEALVRREIAPLTGRQCAKRDTAHPNALEADDFESDQFAHAPNLALLAFPQHEAKLFTVLPAHLRGFERHAVE